MRERERKQREAKDPGYDFTDTHLQTPTYENISGKPEIVLQENRKTVTKIVNKTVVIETEKAQPLNLDKQFSKALLTKMETTKSKVQIIPNSTSSSSSTSSSEND